MAVGLLLAGGLAGALTGCGETPGPGRPEPAPTLTPTPAIRATTTPAPAPTGVPRDGRGIAALHQAGAYAVQVQSAVQAEVDRLEPGVTHVVACRPVPMQHIPGASTRCDVVPEGGLPQMWTAVTMQGSAPDGGLVVEVSRGERTDLPAFPPG
ncbi:hypothetical protein GCM10011314_18900 [Knoellia flava]|uniref:DUF4333 domain-containing protein n=1 Tax=Knoellia flava TaxID=913969 RepID=A0A8H9FST5_9MICO|nr:hypothetical protein GCM10011314_18900 [Knoellia flava]